MHSANKYIRKRFTFLFSALLCFCIHTQAVHATASEASPMSSDAYDMCNGSTLQQTEGPYTYVDMGLSVHWATCNVGADSPEAYGNYYAWGETSTKEVYSRENALTNGKTMVEISGNATFDVAAALWGGAWRMPTRAEYQELLDNSTVTWTTQNGVNGQLFTSNVNGNKLFMPAAGYRYNELLYQVGESGSYWTATPEEGNDMMAIRTGFGAGYSGLYPNGRHFGRSIRPVQTNENGINPGPNPNPNPTPNPNPNPNPQPEPETEVIFFESFAGEAHSFTIDNRLMDAPLHEVWTLDTYRHDHFIKATAYHKETDSRYPSESWLISPVIDLTEKAEGILSFEQAIAYFDGQENFLSACMLKVKEEDSTTWRNVEMKDIPNARFEFNKTSLPLNEFSGKKIQLAWVYTSTASAAGTWEIKNVQVKATTSTSVRPMHSVNAQPVIYDLRGRRVTHLTTGLYIVDGKKVYVK